MFGRWLDGAAADPALGYTRDDYIEHIRTEYSTFRWLLEPMLAATGFEVESVTFHGPLYGAYTCPLAWRGVVGFVRDRADFFQIIRPAPNR